MHLSSKSFVESFLLEMNKLKCLRIISKHTYYHRNKQLFLIGIHHNKLSHSTESKHASQDSSDDNYGDKQYIKMLDNIPSPWSDHQNSSKSDTTFAFKEWIECRSLFEEDGKMLNRLKCHILNGGHPDFPRLLKRENSEKSLQHLTNDYYSSIDQECFKWIKKQKKLYRNKTIHPWLQWKLEQLNVSLEWYLSNKIYRKL